MGRRSASTWKKRQKRKLKIWLTKHFLAVKENERNLKSWNIPQWSETKKETKAFSNPFTTTLDFDLENEKMLAALSKCSKGWLLCYEDKLKEKKKTVVLLESLLTAFKSRVPPLLDVCNKQFLYRQRGLNSALWKATENNFEGNPRGEAFVYECKQRVSFFKVFTNYHKTL